MPGKAMRIAILCTLAFAICGERMKAEEKEEEKTSRTVPSRRWLAKSLLLGASVHAASGFGQPAHSASGFARPAQVHALGQWEPQPARPPVVLHDPLIPPVVLDNPHGRDSINDEPHDPWEEWRPEVEEFLKGGEEKDLEELFLGFMVQRGQNLLARINDESSFVDERGQFSGFEAMVDDVREFQKWQEEAREFYISGSLLLIEQQRQRKSSSKGSYIPWQGGIPWQQEARQLYFSGSSMVLQAQRAVKAAQILDAELSGPKLMTHLQNMKGKHLQSLLLDSPLLKKRSDAEKEKRDAEKEKRDAEKEGPKSE